MDQTEFRYSFPSEMNYFDAADESIEKPMKLKKRKKKSKKEEESCC